MRRLLAAGGIVLGSGLGVGAGLALHRYVPESPLVRGIVVGDRTVTEKNARAALERARAEALARPVYFVHAGELYTASQRELGVELDVDATLLEARAVGHQGGLVRRLRESEQARRGEVAVPFTWRFDPAKARAFLDRLAPAVEKAPVDARLDLKTFQKIADQPGEALDVGATLRRIEQAPREGEATIALVIEPTSAKVTLADLGDIDPSKVLSAHETTFATYGTGVGRSQNIRNAASKIDGLVIAPGQVFSFNERVGPRTLENGFAYAPEIQGDELTTGVGGGTCQVSSTLHIAALFGALQIVERQSHSRPSAYTQMGLDATVSYPKVDLKLRNNMPFPIIVHAFVPEQSDKQKKTNTAAIRVELLGGEPRAKVVYKLGVGSVEDFTRRIYTKPHFPPGKVHRHQKGTRGYSVTSVVTVLWFDGRTEERTFFSGYRPVPEVLWVGPGTDDGELPPLPEHARGVEDPKHRGRLLHETDFYGG